MKNVNTPMILVSGSSIVFNTAAEAALQLAANDDTPVRFTERMGNVYMELAAIGPEYRTVMFDDGVWFINHTMACRLLRTYFDEGRSRNLKLELQETNSPDEWVLKPYIPVKETQPVRTRPVKVRNSTLHRDKRGPSFASINPTEGRISVRIDDKTTVLARAGADPDEVRKKYLKLINKKAE